VSAQEVQLVSRSVSGALKHRLRDVGMLSLTCSRAGELLSDTPLGRDWLCDLFCGSPLFADALGRAAQRWSGESEPAADEVMPGVWVAPMPVLNRRRLIGYSLAVIPTAALLESEHLLAMCQGSHLDYELCKRLLAQLPPAAEADVPRLAAMVRFNHQDQTRLQSDGDAMESVGKQLAESYEEISLLYTIIRSMTVVEQPERFIAIACEELLATLPYAWIGVDLADDRQRLKKLAGRFVFAGETAQPEAKIKALADRLLAQAQVDAPIVLEPASNPRHADYASFGQSALVHPISSDGKVIGLAIAGDKQGEDIKASSVDMKLLGATASHTAIFLENAALYDDLNAMFLGTLEALTASIDAKDRYTCGHSQRVAHLTQQLARAVGLDDHTVSRTRIAGLVHDVGKIGVPERVLLKPGKLTDEEFEWIRRHPEMGYRILKDIPQLEDILPGVLYHHERYDGSGYPAGLAGQDIPLIARLITLADSFDAMSSSRTYRSKLSRAEVLAEVERCAGTQFDPGLAPVFLKLDFSEFDRLVAEHQAGEEAGGIRPRREEAA
jgi:HD-GYP domain-containing protein (c-di-GMP phosphodiesterase class II)